VLPASPISTTVDLVDLQGQRRTCAIAISVPQPERNEDGEAWICRVTMSAWDLDRPVLGVDGFQCVIVATGLITLTLRSFRERGGRVLFAGTDDPLVIDDSLGVFSLFTPFPPIKTTFDRGSDAPGV